MSPILVRPVREQFEHDRVIRELQARYKRKFEVAINPGSEQNASIGVGELTMYPDLVLYIQERGNKLQGTIEVETTESINTLEAMAEWGPLSRLRMPFYLYVPPSSLDTVKRLCAEHQVVASEIWTYHTAVDQVRFTMVHKEPESSVPKGRALPKIEVTIIQKPAPVPPAPVSDAAEAPKLERADNPLKPEPSAKPDGSARPGKGSKAAAPAKPVASPRGSQPATPPLAAKPHGTAKAAVSGKPATPVRPAKPVKSAKPAKGVRPVKATKSAKPAKAAKPGKSAKVAKPRKPAPQPARKATKSAKSKRR